MSQLWTNQLDTATNYTQVLLEFSIELSKSFMGLVTLKYFETRVD